MDTRLEDALTLTFGKKKNLLQKLHDCRDNKAAQLDTLVLDKVLGKLEGFPGVRVFSTYCPWDKRDLPFYARYVTAEEMMAGLPLLFIPLCDDGVHINGFIVNLISLEIIYIDSLSSKRYAGLSETISIVFFKGQSRQ